MVSRVSRKKEAIADNKGEVIMTDSSTADIIAAFRASKEADFTEFLKKLDKKKEETYNELESETEDDK
jgi:hypothetical protein